MDKVSSKDTSSSDLSKTKQSIKQEQKTSVKFDYLIFHNKNKGTNKQNKNKKHVQSLLIW